jgi:transglutaminase/protease-like cytokinesis protein 3
MGRGLLRNRLNRRRALIGALFAVCLGASAVRAATRKDPAELAAVLVREFRSANIVGNFGRSSSSADFAVRRVDVLKPGSASLDQREKTLYAQSDSDVPAANPLVKSLVAALTQDVRSDAEKIAVLHDFVLWRLSYTTHFLELAKSGTAPKTAKERNFDCLRRAHGGNLHVVWLPPNAQCGLGSSAEIASSRVLSDLVTGIDNCYGYAYMFATLARAAGVPTRVVREPWKKDGDSRAAHHWAEVFIKGQWLVVDPTYDDAFDDGDDEDDGTMLASYSYFLITPAQAAHADPRHHREYEYEDR